MGNSYKNAYVDTCPYFQILHNLIICFSILTIQIVHILQESINMKKNVTRKDIAKEAGVSVSVVSRALNNSGYVEKEKKKRILEIAKKAEYVPNPMAMALQQKGTRQLLFFCGDLTGTYYNQMYHGMAREAEKRGYHVLTIMNEKDFEMVKTMLVDGLLFPTEEVAKSYAEAVGKNYYLPSVTACFDPSVVFAKPMPTVVIDNRKVLNLAIDYLKKKGHRKIGIAVPFNEGYANLRYRYWKERMMLELGSECKKYILDVKGDLKKSESPRGKDNRDLSYQSEGFVYMDLFFLGKQAAKLYIQQKFKATAVICFNDDMAFGMMEELKRNGISVPDDVSIMGIDGIYTRERYEPKLTTVAIYPERQGAACVDVLIDILEDNKYKYMNYSPFEVLEGETVKRIESI